MAFRKDVENVTEVPVSPAQPSAFLRSLVKLTKRHTDALQSASADIDDDTLNDQAAAFTENLKGSADAIRSNLGGSQFGEFDMVFSALNYPRRDDSRRHGLDWKPELSPIKTVDEPGGT